MGPRGGALVRMAVRLVVPSAVGPQANLTFEIWRHLDAPPLFPRQREVFVRKSIGEAATEIEMPMRDQQIALMHIGHGATFM